MKVRIQLVAKDNNGNFDVTVASGWVTLLRTLDYDEIKEVKITVIHAVEHFPG